MSNSPPEFHPVWVSNQGRVSLRWGPACDTPREAKRLGRIEYDAGRAPLVFVVRADDEGKKPLLGYVYPEAARKIIEHWEDLMLATE